MLLCLGPVPRSGYCGEQSFQLLSAEHSCCAIGRMPGGPAAHRLLDEIYDVALLDEVVRPSLPAVGRAHPVRRCLRAAVEKNDRIRTSYGLRRQYLDVALAAHDVLAVVTDIVPPDIEVTSS